MAITSLSIYQDNIIEGSNLMPVHSPLVFLVDAVYTTTTPDYIYCKVYEGETLLDTFKCVPLEDVTATQRRFMFIAHSILRGYMDDFEDFSQTNNTLVFVPNITKELTLVFSDPDEDAEDVELDIVAIHGVRQAGQNPNLSEIFSNESETIYAVKDNECYVYFYNDDESNVLSINTPLVNVKFIVSDTSGFVQDALVTINGDSGLTNSGGEVEFELNGNQTYSYSITKDAYETKTGNLTLSTNDVVLNITISEVAPVEFTLEGWSEGATVNIYSDQTFTNLVYTGTLPASKQLTVSLYEGTYYVDVSSLTCDSYGSTRREPMTITDATTYFKTSEPPLATLGQNTVTFIVKDELDSFIENAEITRDGSIYFGNCTLNEMLTDINGEASQVIQNRITYDFFLATNVKSSSPQPYSVSKTGYTTVNGSSTISTDKDINIILNAI